LGIEFESNVFNSFIYRCSHINCIGVVFSSQEGPLGNLNVSFPLVSMESAKLCLSSTLSICMGRALSF